MDRREKHIIPDYDPEDPYEPSFIHEFTIEQSVDKELKERHKPRVGSRRNPSIIEESEPESRDRRSREHNDYLVAQQDQAWYNLQVPVRLKVKKSFLENQNQLIREKIDRDHSYWFEQWALHHPNHTEQEARTTFGISLIKRDELINFAQSDIEFECSPEHLFLEVDSILPFLKKKSTFDW